MASVQTITLTIGGVVLRGRDASGVWGDKMSRDMADLIEAAGLEGEAIAKERVVTQKAVDTGNMLGAIKADMVDEFTTEWSSPAPYSLYVEMGTSQSPARPFGMPALEGARDWLESNAKQRLAQGGLL